MDVIKTAIYDTVQEFNNNPFNTKYSISVNMKCIEEIFKIINYDLITISIDCLKVILSDWNGMLLFIHYFYFQISVNIVILPVFI